MIDYEVNERVATITLNRVEARNAINRQMAEELEAAIDRAEDDAEVWVSVLRAATTGDRPTFCSGQDLKSIGTPDGNSTTTLPKNEVAFLPSAEAFSSAARVRSNRTPCPTRGAMVPAL